MLASIDEKFMASTVILIYSCYHNKVLCDIAMSITKMVLKIEINDYEYEEFFKDLTSDKTPRNLNQNLENLRIKLLSMFRVTNNNIATMSNNHTNNNLKKYNVSQNLISYPIVLPKQIIPLTTSMSTSWPSHIAPSIWQWIHIVTQYIDLNGGYNEKKNFIEFVEYIIHCSECQHHYHNNKIKLIESLDVASLTDTFLILHSTLAINTGFNQPKLNYKFNPDLIKVYHKNMFFKQFSAINQQTYLNRLTF